MSQTSDSISEEASSGVSGLPPVPVLGENISDANLLRAANRLHSGTTKGRSLFAKQLLAAKQGVPLKVDPSTVQPRKRASKCGLFF